MLFSQTKTLPLKVLNLKKILGPFGPSYSATIPNQTWQNPKWTSPSKLFLPNLPSIYGNFAWSSSGPTVSPKGSAPGGVSATLATEDPCHWEQPIDPDRGMLLWKVFGGRWFRLNCWQILWGRLNPNSSLPFFERNPITEYWKQGAMRWHSPTGWCWCYDVWNCAQVELWQMPKDGNSTSNHVVPISIMINTRILEKHLTSLGFMPWSSLTLATKRFKV